MKIDQFSNKFYEDVIRIHRKFYKEEFSVPDFMSRYINAFAISNDQSQVVLIGGVRPILEVVALTDKDVRVKDRRSALIHLQEACALSARYYGFTELHSFVQDKTWKSQLESHGWNPTKGTSLVIGVK